jgi:DNA-binding NarL/FixJ family response regulator
MKQAMIRVLIVDDYRLVRQAIRTILSRETDVEVVGEAEDGEAAVALTESLQPDVVLMDISMPRVDGIEALRRIRKHKLPARIIILSMHISSVLVREAINKGANGYLRKGGEPEELLQAVRRVSQGKTYLDSAATFAIDS